MYYVHFYQNQRLIVRKLVIRYYKLPGHFGLKSSREFTRVKFPGVLVAGGGVGRTLMNFNNLYSVCCGAVLFHYFYIRTQK